MQLRELDPDGFEEYLAKAKAVALSVNHHDVARILQLHEIAYSKDSAPPPLQSPHTGQVRIGKSDAVKVTFRPPSRRPPPLDLDNCGNDQGLRIAIPSPVGKRR